MKRKRKTATRAKLNITWLTHRSAPTLRWKYKFQCRLLLRQLGSPTGNQKYLRDCSPNCRRHDFHCDGDEAHVKPVVSPTSKLDRAVLVVEGEPSDVNLTGGFEYSRRNIGTPTLVSHHHVGWVGSIELLVSAETYSFTRGNKFFIPKMFFLI